MQKITLLQIRPPKNTLYGKLNDSMGEKGKKRCVCAMGVPLSECAA